MAKHLSLLGVFLLSGFSFFGSEAASAAGPTIITDDVVDVSAWTKEESPYVIVGSVSVRSSVSIEPGVSVLFRNDPDTGGAAELVLSSGKISAIGTEAEPIVFTKESEADMFSLRFDDDNIYYGEAEFSNFQYVHIIGGGEAPYDGGGGVIGFFRNLLMKTAHAFEFEGVPALTFWAGKLSIQHSVFSGSQGVDVWISDSGIDEWGSEEDGDYWKDTSFLNISDSNFGGDLLVPAFFSEEFTCESPLVGECENRVALRNNWYGASSGPKSTDNPTGTGKEIIGKVIFEGWSTMEHGVSVMCADCASNVLFLPGLEASRLYMSGNPDDPHELWEPYGDDGVAQLNLDEDGESIHSNIYAKDVIDTAYLPIKGNIYRSFIEDMNGMKGDGVITDWKPIAYDWRLALDDIIGNGKEMEGGISYTDSAPVSYIVSELERLAASSKTGKVTIIAHSNGGLVAKALVRKLGDAEATRLIDRVVMVAVPQSGTPQAIGAILHGYEQGVPISWMPFFLSPKASREMAHNMPGAYHLLPSDTYFSGEGSGVETPVITFKDDSEITREFIDRYGTEIGSGDELREFLSDDEWKVSPDSDNLTSPATANDALVGYGNDVHQSLGDMAIPESIEVHQIAGFGEETLGTIRYWTESWCALAKANDGGCIEVKSRLTFTPERMVDGDGTVVGPSALAMSTGASNVKRYWVDLFDYNDTHIDREHAGILEVQELRDFIRNNLIAHSTTTFPDYVSNSEPPTDSEKRLRFYLHSPLSLSARDEDGNEISADTSDIPGARFRRFGEVQYISVPASVHPTVMLSGETEGSFTLEVREMDGETITYETIYTGIPSIVDTEATMSFPDGTLENALPLSIDYDGDGKAEHELAPAINGTVMLLADTTPPKTSVSLSGPEGANGWYLGDVTVTLSATDNENGDGVEKTEYSSDGGLTWQIYAEPIVFPSEGTTVLLYRSSDKAGNVEEEKTVEVKIDKTAPEARISFDPGAQKLDIRGVDNLPGDVLVSTSESVVLSPPPAIPSEVEESRNWKSWLMDRFRKKEKKTFVTATLTDQAGHTTEITFEKVKNRGDFIFVRMKSIAYDGGGSVALDTVMQYKWRTDRKGLYRLFASHLRTDDSAIESHYFPKRDETWIMDRPRELGDDDRDDDADRRPKRTKFPGMVVPYMITETGEISTKY